jgi:hypothetical protein
MSERTTSCAPRGRAKALIWWFALVLIGVSCAKRGLPGGGPKDETPPFVSRWYPATGTGGVDRDFWIEIEWNEPVERGSVEGSILVSPDTSIIERKWKDQQLRLRPRAGWIPDITHWIWVRRGIVDRHELSSEEPFGMWFSTGDSVPPTMIDGSVRLGVDEPAVDATITAIGSDSVLVWITSSDEAGAFSMHGLEPGPWRLEAFVDVDGDGQYRFGAEPWGEEELILAQDSTVTLAFSLAVVDTSPPVIFEALAVHRGHIRLVFSEPIFGLQNTSFSLIDTMGQRYSIAAAYASFLDPAIVHVYLEDGMRDDQMELAVSDGQDSVGLGLADTVFTFLGTSLADTVPPLIQNLFYSDEQPLQVCVAFSEPVRAETVDDGLVVSELPGCRQVLGIMEWLDPSLVSWTADDSLGEEGRYLLTLDDIIADFSGLPLQSATATLVPTVSDSSQPPWEQRILIKRGEMRDSLTLNQSAVFDSS